MRIKSFIAAAGALALFAAFLATPASAQTQTATSNGAGLRQLPPEAEQHDPADGGTALRTSAGSACQACHDDASDQVKDPTKNACGYARVEDRERRGEIGGVPRLPRRITGASRLGGRQAPQGRRDVRRLPVDARHAIGERRRARSGRAVRRGAVPRRCGSLPAGDASSATPTCAPKVLKPGTPDHRRQGRVPGCRDPRRAFKASLRNDSVVDLCMSSHADKRGPGIHERPPVEGTAPSPTRRTAPRARACSRRSRRRYAPTATRTAARTASPMDAGRFPRTLPSNVRFIFRGCVVASGSSTAAARRRPPTANTSYAEIRGEHESRAHGHRRRRPLGAARLAVENFMSSRSAKVGSRGADVDSATRNSAYGNTKPLSAADPLTPFVGPTTTQGAGVPDVDSAPISVIDVRDSDRSYYLHAFGRSSAAMSRDQCRRWQLRRVEGGDLRRRRPARLLVQRAVTAHQRRQYAARVLLAQRQLSAAGESERLGQVDYGTQRNTTGGNFEVSMKSPWFVRADYNEVRTNGIKPSSGQLERAPATASSSRRPADYKTQNTFIEGGYNTKQYGLKLAYFQSKFTDSNDSCSGRTSTWATRWTPRCCRRTTSSRSGASTATSSSCRGIRRSSRGTPRAS